MNASFRRLAWSSLALFALVGCDATPPPPPPPTAPTPAPGGEVIKSMPVEPAKPDEAKDKGAATDPNKLTDGELAEIKKLPAEDQPIALAQVNCPVSGGHLGMEVPIKQVVDGKTFFLCCSGCLDDVKKDPAGVLAKLKK